MRLFDTRTSDDHLQNKNVLERVERMTVTSSNYEASGKRLLVFISLIGILSDQSAFAQYVRKDPRLGIIIRRAAV